MARAKGRVSVARACYGTPPGGGAIKNLIATVFCLGWIPGAPGTWAGIAAAALFVAVGMPTGIYGVGAAVGLSLLGLWAASGAKDVFGEADPGPVVIDELAGMWVALVAGAAQTAPAVVAAFILFRVLDIAKPFGIRRLERIRGANGAAGIMADDLAAGLLAGAIVRIAGTLGLL